MAIPLTGCSQKVYIYHDCPTIKPLKKIDSLDLYTDNKGRFTVKSSYDAKTLIGKLRVKETYYDSETKRLIAKVKELKDET